MAHITYDYVAQVYRMYDSPLHRRAAAGWGSHMCTLGLVRSLLNSNPPLQPWVLPVDVWKVLCEQIKGLLGGFRHFQHGSKRQTLRGIASADGSPSHMWR